MILLLVSFVAGVLTVLAPCVLPLLPVIVGGSLSGGSRRRAYAICVSLGVSIVAFTLLLKATTVFLGVPQQVWQWISGGILLAFGFTMVFPRLWDSLPFVSTLNRRSNVLLALGYRRNSFFGDMLMGAALGPVFASCSPTYFVILATVLPASFLVGLLDLTAYAVGLSGFLLIIALAGQRLVDRLGITIEPGGWFRRSIGALFILVGLLVATGTMTRIEIWLLDRGFFDVTGIEQRILGAREKMNSPKEAAKVLASGEKERIYAKAPDISSPDGFVNTDGKPITLKELRGKVVLLDIWTYSCINCQRTLPYLNTWYAKYEDQGLEIIGLHTPEFAFERVQKNVEAAVKDLGIRYPVVLDNDYSTWNAYGNRYWPRKYLIDIDGYIVYDHIGEGGYEETERAIQKALAEKNDRMGSSASVSTTISEPEGAMNAESGKVKSPEIYFGSSRNQYLTNGRAGVSGEQVLQIPETVRRNNLYLGGIWNITEEFAQNAGAASVVFPFDAKSVYLVAGSDSPVTIRVYQDGVFMRKSTVDEEKLYPLIENEEYGEHTLRIEIESPGLQAFTFTFG